MESPYNMVFCKLIQASFSYVPERIWTFRLDTPGFISITAIHKPHNLGYICKFKTFFSFDKGICIEMLSSISGS